MVHRQRMEAYGRSVRNGEEQSLRFAGQVEDAHSGTYYNFHRNYEARSGRYTQWDPIGLRGGVNVYGYAGGNAVNGLDPYGLMLCEDWGWMAIDWALGLGSRNRTYGDFSDQVQEVAKLPGVEKAKNAYRQKNAYVKGECCDPGKLQALTNWRASFGWSGYLGATWRRSCAGHFIGSYRVDIFPISCDRARIRVTNNSSFTSFMYGIGPSWSGGPGGNFYQTYEWEEQL